MRLSQDYYDFLRERFGHVDDIFEWCSGPGYLGYTMLARNLTKRLCLADVNPKAVFYAQKTREKNVLDDYVRIYQSNNLDSIPEHEKWDLVIGNPPHYGGSSDYFSEIDRRGLDRDWNIHRSFLISVASHLKPNGRLCIIEWHNPKIEHSSTPELFYPMLESGGLVFEDAVNVKQYRTIII